MVIVEELPLLTVKDVRFTPVSVVIVCAALALSTIVRAPARVSVNVVIVVALAPARDKVAKLASVIPLIVLVPPVLLFVRVRIELDVATEFIYSAFVPARVKPDRDVSASVMIPLPAPEALVVALVLLSVNVKAATLVDTYERVLPEPFNVSEARRVSLNAPTVPSEATPIKLSADDVDVLFTVKLVAVSPDRVLIANAPEPEIFNTESFVSVSVVMS